MVGFCHMTSRDVLVSASEQQILDMTETNLVDYRHVTSHDIFVSASEQQILDMTETNLVGFRRTVYLTIQSSLDFEECAHKLLRMDIKPGWEVCM